MIAPASCNTDARPQIHNQMDTTQAHLSSKGDKLRETAKPDNLSKDELTAVLKYGAQKM